MVVLTEDTMVATEEATVVMVAMAEATEVVTEMEVTTAVEITEVETRAVPAMTTMVELS